MSLLAFPSLAHKVKLKRIVSISCGKSGTSLRINAISCATDSCPDTVRLEEANVSWASSNVSSLPLDQLMVNSVWGQSLLEYVNRSFGPTRDPHWPLWWLLSAADGILFSSLILLWLVKFCSPRGQPELLNVASICWSFDDATIQTVYKTFRPLVSACNWSIKRDLEPLDLLKWIDALECILYGVKLLRVARVGLLTFNSASQRTVCFWTVTLLRLQIVLL